jgi:hypothetical protein
MNEQKYLKLKSVIKKIEPQHPNWCNYMIFYMHAFNSIPFSEAESICWHFIDILCTKEKWRCFIYKNKSSTFILFVNAKASYVWLSLTVLSPQKGVMVYNYLSARFAATLHLWEQFAPFHPLLGAKQQQARSGCWQGAGIDFWQCLVTGVAATAITRLRMPSRH